MSKKIKYDVAISFAEEDDIIANAINTELQDLGLKTYYYKDETAENWGGNLFNILIDRYKERSKFSLVLISQHYVGKRWAEIERQLIQTVFRNGESGYMLPLRLDNTQLPGLTYNILHAKYKDNPKEIAEMVMKKIESAEKIEKKKKKERKVANQISADVNQVNSDNKGVIIGKGNYEDKRGAKIRNDHSTRNINTHNYTEEGHIHDKSKSGKK
ncbi:MAG: TIR domain-containing protein [Cyclobacteriaceae bacterium]